MESNDTTVIIQVDSRFTTTTQIVKLVNSHTISKILVKISDIKRTKMVRVINIYYNNRTVQAVIELKNKPGKIFGIKCCFHESIFVKMFHCCCL